MISELCCIYGYTLDYVLENLSFYQINYMYVNGYRHTMRMNGFEVKETEEEKKEAWEEIRKTYYTEEERKLQEEYLKEVGAKK